MIYCKYCYRMLEDGTEVCTACGKPLQRKGIFSKVPPYFQDSSNSFSSELNDEPIITTVDLYVHAKTAELTEHSKKERTVQRVTLEDMKQFISLPFTWNSEIQKVIGPSTQPYAFMNIIGSNVYAAQLALEEMNNHLLKANKHIYPAYRIIEIPIDEIIFTPRAETSYSKIICTPHTFTGKVSKYPASLFFTTELETDIDTTHGELFYNRSGKIEKAKVVCWRQHNCFCFYYKTIDGHLTLDRIEFSAPRYEGGECKTIYKNQK